MGMGIIAKGVFLSIPACGEKVEFHFVRFLREDCIESKNKQWNAGKKPEEKSVRSTLKHISRVTTF